MSALDAVADWTVGLMGALGAPGAGLAIALENIFPPLPSELILPLAGFAAARGTFGLVEVLAWTTLGSLVGALALYGLGAWLGADRLRRIAARLPLVDAADVDRAEAWFARHGGKTVLLGRMVPIFRSLISIPAGIARMPLLRFSVLTALGSAVWNAALILAGYLLGENWGVVERYTGAFQTVVIVAVVAAVAWFVVMRVVRGRRKSG
ncbi:MAG: DedA family protein [Pseudoclavibacter sp.]|jgi:membrane protein DedA with SNARE-associated domain